MTDLNNNNSNNAVVIPASVMISFFQEQTAQVKMVTEMMEKCLNRVADAIEAKALRSLPRLGGKSIG